MSNQLDLELLKIKKNKSTRVWPFSLIEVTKNMIILFWYKIRLKNKETQFKCKMRGGRPILVPNELIVTMSVSHTHTYILANQLTEQL